MTTTQMISMISQVIRRNLAVVAALVLTATAGSAAAQSLRDRIDTVREQNKSRQVQASPRVELLQTLIYTRLTVDFQETPTREVFEYMATALGVPFVGRYEDDPAAHGIDPDAPITLTARDMFALDILEAVLEQCTPVEECTWQLRRNAVEVGTKERLSVPAARTTHVYGIEGLLFKPPDFDGAPGLELKITRPDYYYDPYGRGGGLSGGFGGSSGPVIYTSTGSAPTPDENDRAKELVELIVSIIEPDAWNRNGGMWATIDYIDGALVVRAPDYIHRQLGSYPKVAPPARLKRP